MSRLRLNKIVTPAAPAANKGELFYSSSLSPAALAFIDESGNVARVVTSGSTKDYRLVKRIYLYNGTTTYTPTTGVAALHIEAIGGGGAGGGAAASGGTNSAAGGGGGGGGGARVWSTANVSGAHTVAIGAGGTVGTAGANAGNAGGNSTFADTAAATIAQANGGTGGAGGATAVTVAPVAAGGAGGTASGTPAEGPTGTTWQGEDGDYSLRFGVAAPISGKGGGSQYGSGGPSIIASGTGSAGRKYGGAGAGGADIAATNTARTGGAGANGILVVEEWA